jgi:hypothetical protein
MSLIKKIDLPLHFAARRSLRLDAARPVILPRATGVSVVEPAGTQVNASAFGDDFLSEHCVASAPQSPARPEPPAR